MAKDAPKDVIINVFDGMCADVRHMFEEKRYAAFIVLTYAAIDAIANATRFGNKKASPKRDFIDWITRYFQVPGPAKPLPEELWSARCAIIHTYGIMNENHIKDPSHRIVTLFRSSERSTKQRLIGGKLNLFIDLQSFHDAFQNGVQQSLTDAMANEARRPVVEERLSQFVQSLPIDPKGPIGKFFDGME